jgi:hypothetical protein
VTGVHRIGAGCHPARTELGCSARAPTFPRRHQITRGADDGVRSLTCVDGHSRVTGTPARSCLDPLPPLEASRLIRACKSNLSPDRGLVKWLCGVKVCGHWMNDDEAILDELTRTHVSSVDVPRPSMGSWSRLPPTAPPLDAATAAVSRFIDSVVRRVDMVLCIRRAVADTTAYAEYHVHPFLHRSNGILLTAAQLRA